MMAVAPARLNAAALGRRRLQTPGAGVSWGSKWTEGKPLAAADAKFSRRRRFLTSGELARLGNMSKRAVVKAIAAGRLKASTTVGGHYRIALATARSFLAARGLDPAVLEVRENCALVVARDRAVGDLLADMLSRLGLELLRAAQLFEAGVLCTQHRPALMVLDTAAAAPDGESVCRSVAANENLRRMRILVLASRDPEEIRRYQFAGADAVLSKPFSMAELKAAIAEFGLGQEVRRGRQ